MENHSISQARSPRRAKHGGTSVHGRAACSRARFHLGYLGGRRIRKRFDGSSRNEIPKRLVGAMSFAATRFVGRWPDDTSMHSVERVQLTSHAALPPESVGVVGQ